MGRRALRDIAANLDLSRHLKTFEQLPACKKGDWLGAIPERAEPVPSCDVPAPFFPRADFAVALFGRAAPLEVEIGSGKGLFLAGAAATRPEHDFLGIEMATKYARHAAARLARRELPNAILVHGDALRLFHELLPAGSLEAVHVYFPDPWWKARHKKRRVLNEALVADVVRTLRSGGRLHFWTDVEEYYQSTLELIAPVSELIGPIEVAEMPAQHDLDYRTHFERRTRLHCEPVYRAEFERATRSRESISTQGVVRN